ncbi:MAG TPA: redoxin domain-containing protein [Steroidobacteraceae bacterium]|nr:redoxin domain-containing protein [Steroidobacteraceae bacterium]
MVRMLSFRSSFTVFTTRVRRTAACLRSLGTAVLFGALLASSSAHADLAGTTAPDFVLKSLAGTNLRLSEYLGEVVMLNFWASWCGSCRQEMPQLDRLYATYRSAGFVVLGVNVDDDTTRAVDVANALKVSYPVLLDPRKSVAPKYRLDELPMSVLIDRSGVVRFVHSDYQAGKEQPYVAELRRLLNE